MRFAPGHRGRLLPRGGVVTTSGGFDTTADALVGWFRVRPLGMVNGASDGSGSGR